MNSDKTENEHHDDHETHEIDDAVHDGSPSNAIIKTFDVNKGSSTCGFL